MCVLNAFNPSARVAKADESLTSWASLVYLLNPNKQGLHSNTSSQKKKKKKPWRGGGGYERETLRYKVNE